MSSEHNIIHTDERTLGHANDLDDVCPEKESETKVLIRGAIHLSLLIIGSAAISFGIVMAFYTTFKSLMEMFK